MMSVEAFPCQSCQKPNATVHQIEVVYPEGREPQLHHLHLCGPCAKSAGMPVPANVPSFPKVVSLLSKAFLAPQAIVPAGKDTACPECGWSLRDFRQTSRFGCPRDYEVFSEFVKDLLEQLHGSNEHPASPADAELGRLTREMNAAVEREDYEAAARLRDRIRELETRLEHGQETSSEDAGDAKFGSASH
ncbi:MAG: DNA helicase UvrBC [Planctomycetota bacterium]|nr:MAG: DNA helicase UvrBC [Planctomycetota bacterium]